MKTIALFVVLALHTTSLWPHTPAPARDRLAHIATSGLREQIKPTPAATNVTNLPQPIRTNNNPLTLSDTTSAIAIDRATATTLYTQDAGKQRPIASTTKLVTALVILSRHSLDETVTVSELPTYDPATGPLGLKAGESYRLSDLLRAVLVPSANDAADALALYDSGSITKFAAQMNLKLDDWGITGARFNNASGLLDEGNYATATALSRIALLALQNPFIRETVNHTEITFTSSTGRVFTAATTNKLLATGRYYGIKTGYTLAAGQCFIGITKINGHEVVTIILGSPDRFGETETLVNWISQNYQWL